MELAQIIIFGLVIGVTASVSYTFGYVKAMRSVSKQIEQLRALTKQTRLHVKRIREEQTPIYDQLLKEFNEAD